jgi:hypothetical protein
LTDQVRVVRGVRVGKTEEVVVAEELVQVLHVGHRFVVVQDRVDMTGAGRLLALDLCEG